MKRNELTIYKKSIFKKISEFFKNIFSKKKASQNEDNIIKNDKNNSFIQNIKIKENEKELRLLQLKRQYESGEIEEDDIQEEDIDKLCEMYKKETEELNADTERRKKNIEQMIKGLKRF